MFRYLLVFIIVNTYGRGLGVPLQRTSQISALFEELALKCDNKIITPEIRSKIDECAQTFVSPRYSEKHFQCLLFYDINTQLCASKVIVSADDYKTKMNENINAQELCEHSTSWTIMDILNYPQYKATLTKIVASNLKCSKICTVDDILSDEANYYCKYYNWGSSLLKSLSNPSAQPLNSSLPIDTLDKSTKPVVQSAVKPEGLSGQTVTKQTEKGIQDKPKNISETPEVQTVNENKNPEIPEVPTGAANNKSDTSEVALKDKNIPDVINQQTSSNAQEANALHNEVIVPQKVETANHEASKPSEDDQQKIMPVEEEPPKISADADAEVEKSFEGKEAVLENPKLKPDQNVDYQDGDLDSEEGKEGMMDQNLDGGDDPGVGDFEQKPSVDKLTTIKKFDMVASSFEQLEPAAPPRNRFTNTDLGFTDGDDDNFFPFFLTGVIMVVLLYVLYHNKSKVSKVILGLIVEGRQPGRRRNSNGHHYRRLDTLEQAMSSKSTAEPSKIIY